MLETAQNIYQVVFLVQSALRLVPNSVLTVNNVATVVTEVQEHAGLATSRILADNHRLDKIRDISRLNAKTANLACKAFLLVLRTELASFTRTSVVNGSAYTAYGLERQL